MRGTTKDPQYHCIWDHGFHWTDEHVLPEKKDPMKFTYDTLAEEALKRIDIICPPGTQPKASQSTKSTETGGSPEICSEKPPAPAKRNLYELLRDNAANDEVLAELWDQVNHVPEWVDWAQIERGQKIFYRYAVGALTGLAFQGLVGGMASNRVVETLARTGGFSTKVARHRFFETFQHVLECTRSLPDIQPGGAGHASSVKVRLLHASVRQRIMKLVGKHPNYYDVQKYGIPINDLDCIQAIGTYSTNLMFIQLPRQNIYPRKQEIEDYIALFRYIAHIVGTPTEAFETPSNAKAWMESIIMTEVYPTDTGKVLANNIINCLEDTPPAYISREFLEAGSRWLNGNELCDGLGIGRPGWYYWALMEGQCWLSKTVAYTARSISWLDEKQIAFFRKLLYDYIVEGDTLGGPSQFDYKYVPDTGKKTSYEDDAQRTKDPNVFSFEKVYLYAFLIGCFAIAVGALFGVRVSVAASRSLISVIS